jgi:ribosome-binding protein aMBF1 (putative translation factor)
MESKSQILEAIRLTGKTNKEFAKSINLPKTRLDAILSGNLSRRADIAKIEQALGVTLTPAKKSNLKPIQGYKSAKPNKPPSAKGKSCVNCGVDDGTIVPCHYCGLRQHQLGKGTGLKCDHAATAEFCYKCHVSFDQPEQRKSITASKAFLAGIIKTHARRHSVNFMPNLAGLSEEKAEAYLFSIVQLIVALLKKD